MSTADPTGLLVRGGVGGVAVAHEAVRALADDLDDLGSRMRQRGTATLAAAADGDLLLSAALAPASFARAEAALLAAATGADGAIVSAATWEAGALAVRATVTGLDATDALAGLALGRLAHGLGAVVGPAALGSAAVGLGALAAHPATWPLLLAGRSSAEHLARRLGGVAVTHPGLVGPTVLAAAGGIDGLSRVPLAGPVLGPPSALAGPAGTGAATGLLASAYGPETAPSVVVVGGPAAVPPPRGAADLLAGVAAAGDAAAGTISVDTLRRADGTRAHVVHLPGTDDMTTLPWTRDADVRDLGTNLRLAAGDDTTYGRGVVEALDRAGVAPGEPVMLVGHSQGGMQAAAVAAADTPYDVRQVVSAGAPLGPDLRLPPGVGLLALEHVGDPVPRLDAGPPPDTRDVVTVTFETPAHGPPDPVERHGLARYREGAAALDASAHPSWTEHRRRWAADGFVDAVGAERRVLRITR